MNHFYLNNPSFTIPINSTTRLLKSSNSLAYHQSIDCYKSSPLIELPLLAKKYGVNNIYIKDESQRFGLHSFKALGATFAIEEILKEQPLIEIFCTATDGNHGRAVAWAAKRLKKRAIIFVPKNISAQKVTAIENEGAKVIKSYGNYDQTCRLAEEESKKNNWQLVQDTSWKNYEKIPATIMAGYLTHFIELETELHTLPVLKVDLVFLQAGVGSWAASAIWYYLNRYGKNCPKIVLVEPLESAGILTSFENNALSIPNGNGVTIMAGLNCGIPSKIAWDILYSGAHAAMCIEDFFTLNAMKILKHPQPCGTTINSGASGAAGFAGFLATMNDDRFIGLKNSLKINENTNVLFFNTEADSD